MRLEPVNGWINARASVVKMNNSIVIPGATNRVTRIYVIDEVSEEAASKGYKPGDMVIAKLVHDMLFQAGTYHRVTFPASEVVNRVYDLPLSELVDVIHGKPLEGVAEAALAAS